VSPPTPPSGRSTEPAVTVRDELEVRRVRKAPAADAVPFVRHVPPEPGSPEATQAVPVPLRASPDLVVELDSADEPPPSPAGPPEAGRAPGQDQVFTTQDVLPERRSWRRWFSR
jgi:hypothetical protein